MAVLVLTLDSSRQLRSDPRPSSFNPSVIPPSRHPAVPPSHLSPLLGCHLVINCDLMSSSNKSLPASQLYRRHLSGNSQQRETSDLVGEGEEVVPVPRPGWLAAQYNYYNSVTER